MPFLLAGAQIRGPLAVQFGFPDAGLDGQFLFALFELGLEGHFLLQQFLLQARIGLARLGFKLVLQFRLPASRLLLAQFQLAL